MNTEEYVMNWNIFKRKTKLEQDVAILQEIVCPAKPKTIKDIFMSTNKWVMSKLNTSYKRFMAVWIISLIVAYIEGYAVGIAITFLLKLGMFPILGLLFMMLNVALVMVVTFKILSRIK